MPESKRYKESQKTQSDTEKAPELEIKEGKAGSTDDQESGTDVVDAVPKVRQKAPFTGALDAYLERLTSLMRSYHRILTPFFKVEKFEALDRNLRELVFPR